MKNMKRIIVSFLLIPAILLLSILSFSNYVYAEDNSLPNVTLFKNEVINHDYFAAGKTVNISGTVNGDAYIAGGNVTFDGVVNGDLLVAGGNVTILGKVTGDVRTAGGNIIFSSDVGRNATILGGSISMSETGWVMGSLVSAGGNVSINSPVGKEINVAAGQVILGNRTDGNVNAYTGNLSLSPNAHIKGDLNYWSDKEIQINSEASISGTTNYHYAQTPQYKEKEAKEIGDTGNLLGIVTTGALIFYLYSFVVSLIVGLLIIRLLPIFTADTVKTLETHPWTSLGIGFLTVTLFPITFIILLVTIVGIPIAFVLLMALILLWLISGTFVALFVGTKLLNYFRKEASSKGWSLFTGLLILGILSLIPIINFFTGTLTMFFGIGALIIQKKNSYMLLRKKQLI